MDSTRQRRKYAPRLTRDERRAQALDAALEVLGGCALHELSMEAVAAAAGVAKPVLYTAFSTRAELVEALLERERERGIAEVRAAMPDDLSTLGPTGAYTATIGAFLKAVLNNPTGWRLILTVPDSAPATTATRCAAPAQPSCGSPRNSPVPGPPSCRSWPVWIRSCWATPCCRSPRCWDG